MRSRGLNLGTFHPGSLYMKSLVESNKNVNDLRLLMIGSRTLKKGMALDI